MRVWPLLLIIGCIPPLENECSPTAPCAAGDRCVEGVCVALTPRTDTDADFDFDETQGATDANIDSFSPDVEIPACPPGFIRTEDGDCHHGCPVPGPHGALVTATGGPAAVGDFDIATGDPNEALLTWAAGGRLKYWLNGEVR